MFHTIFRKLLSFTRDRRGIVLYLVALLIVPFVILLGVAVDAGQLLVAKNQLQAALDATALNVGKNPGLTSAQAQAHVQAFLNANFSSQSNATVSNLSLTRTPTTGTPNTINISATATINTFFLNIAGYQTLSANLTSQAVVAQNYMEVVLVLDNTGSMAETAGSTTKIQGLINASTELTNILFAADPTLQYVKIGVVPFTSAVNVGAANVNASWLDTSGLGSLTRENLAVPAGKGLLTLFNEFKIPAWAGCVRQRNEPYDIEDVAPTATIPDTLYTPFLAPDEPDKGNFYNNYLADGACYTGRSTAKEEADQQCIAKYQNGIVLNPQGTLTGYGPNLYCPAQSLLRLSNDQETILNIIGAMTANGNTVLPTGLMWGWHTISPNGPFGDGVAYSDTKTIKAIILVTDGDNDVSGGGNNFNKSVYNAYGYGSGPHLNILPASGGNPQPESNLIQKTLQLCDNIKAVKDQSGNSRIIIYTIGLGTSISANGLNILQTCASSSSTFFANPTADELVTTFQNIAIGLNALRISD